MYKNKIFFLNLQFFTLQILTKTNFDEKKMNDFEMNYD